MIITPKLLEEANNGLSVPFRQLLAGLPEQVRELNARTADYDKRVV